MNWTPEEYDRHIRKASQTRPARPGRTPVAPVALKGFDPFLALLEAEGLPAPETEAEFIEGRKFRADYLWRRPRKVVLERQGGIYRKGGGTATMGHSSVTGLLRDWEKSNLAQLAGYVYLQFTPQQLAAGECIPLLRILLRQEFYK